MDMSPQLHILPCTSSDKLKKSFLDQLSLHVELNRKASSTVSLPLIVIFRPQGRPNDEFDGVVLPFLDKVKSSCKDVILFTGLATSQLYGRGFTPACASRFKYMDKLFITAGHLDTQINKSTLSRFGDILVQEYGFKQTSGNQPQLEREQGPIQPSGNQDMDKHSISGSEANNEEEKRKSPCSDANREVDKSKRSGSHLHKQVYTDSSTGDNRQGNNDNSARNILRSVKEAMEKETTALQRKVEKRFELPPGKLLTILDAVLEELAQKPKTAELLENYRQRIQEQFNNRTAALQKDVETRLKVPPGKLLTILEVVLKYADQERKVTKSGPEEKLAFRK